MAYREWIYKSPWGIEHVIQYKGAYGGKHEKRGEREKITKDQIRQQNQQNKSNNQNQQNKKNENENY